MVLYIGMYQGYTGGLSTYYNKYFIYLCDINWLNP